MTFSLRLTNLSGVDRALCALVLAGILGACTTFKTGLPIASSQVPAPSVSIAQDVATEAFAGLGFKVFSRNDDTVTMDRPASKTGEVLYGNWNDSVSLERVVIEITPGKAGLYKITCFPYAVRNAGTGMEDVQRRIQTYSKEYSRAMREITKRMRAVDAAQAREAAIARSSAAAANGNPAPELAR